MSAPLDNREYLRWRLNADAALRGAEVQREASLHNWSCFACEQAAQLAIKAVLHGIGAGAWGHDLVELADMLTAAGLELPGDVRRDVEQLARHYVPTRYPDALAGGSPVERYGPADSGGAIEQCQRILTFVDAAWSALSDA